MGARESASEALAAEARIVLIPTAYSIRVALLQPFRAILHHAWFLLLSCALIAVFNSVCIFGEFSNLAPIRRSPSPLACICRHPPTSTTSSACLLHTRRAFCHTGRVRVRLRLPWPRNVVNEDAERPAPGRAETMRLLSTRLHRVRPGPPGTVFLMGWSEAPERYVPCRPAAPALSASLALSPAVQNVTRWPL